jgi:hypothetical protein
MDIDDILEEMADTSSNDQEIDDLQEALRECWTLLDQTDRMVLWAWWKGRKAKR